MDSCMLGWSGLLAIATHLLFHLFEPKGIKVPISILLVEPGALIYALSSACYSGLIIWTIATVYGVFFLSLALSIVIYRLSPFHPLAQFPGPAISKISKLWGAWIQWQGHRHLVLEELHDQYGPFVRIGPNEVSIVELDAITSVLGPSGLPKGYYYDARKDPTTASHLIIMSGEGHTNRRRLWNRGMNTQSLKEYEVFLANRAEQLQARLAESSGGMDLASWLSFFSFDFVGDMAFGGGFEMLRDGGDRDGIWSAIESSLGALAVLSHIPWASLAAQRAPFLSHRVNKIRKFGASCAINRLENGALVKDLWYHLTDEAGLEETKPPMSGAIADGVMALVAGADTTATAMTSLFYLILKHPDVYKRLQTEIDAVFPKGENALDVSKHPNMPYLTACINETLRVHPVVPVNGPRLVPPGSGGKMIAGRFIPESTQIYVPPYLLHRDPRYFYPSPERFWPERWMSDGWPKSGPFVHNAAAFLAFSYGPANCVGQALARREMMMVVSLLLQKFDMRFEDGFDSGNWEYGLHDHWVMKRAALRLVVTARS